MEIYEKGWLSLVGTCALGGRLGERGGDLKLLVSHLHHKLGAGAGMSEDFNWKFSKQSVTKAIQCSPCDRNSPGRKKLGLLSRSPSPICPLLRLLFPQGSSVGPWEIPNTASLLRGEMRPGNRFGVHLVSYQLTFHFLPGLPLSLSLSVSRSLSTLALSSNPLY